MLTFNALHNKNSKNLVSPSSQKKFLKRYSFYFDLPINATTAQI